MVAITFLVASLISITTLSAAGVPNGPRQVTQTVPVFGSVATSTGLTPTLMVATTAWLASLISETVLSRLLTTHTVPLR